MSDPIVVRGLSPREVLGLPASASADEVRGAFRLLARAVHPDVLPRGSGLFQILAAANEAAQVGNAWPALRGDGFGKQFPPAPPKPSKPKPAWRQNKKGNWFRKSADGTAYITVYEKNDGWHWVGPDEFSGASTFSDSAFDTAEAAMADADENFPSRRAS